MPSADVLALTGTTQLNRWNVAAPVGTSVVVTFSFPTSVPSYDGNSRPGFTALTEAQKSYARQALETWGAAGGISFVEVPDSVGGQIRISLYDQTGLTNATGNQLSGFGYYPQYWSIFSGGSYNYETYFNGLGGDIYMNSVFYGGQDASMAPGIRGYSILLHEIGHTLGFKHPFEGSPTIDPSHDNSTYTVMSYNRPQSTTTLGSVDIEAIQYYYGASDLAYSFDATNLVLSRSGTSSSEWVLGTELPDFLAGYAGDDTIRGELGSDYLAGGDGADLMLGGDGNDAMIGGAGVDRFDGGNGNDIVYADALDNLTGSTGGGGTDTLYVSGAPSGFSFNYTAYGFETMVVGGAGVNYAQWAELLVAHVQGGGTATNYSTNSSGGQRITTWDTTSAQTYAFAEDDYNTAGQREQLRTYYDDGSRRTSGYDTGNTQPYYTYEEDYTVTGARSQLRTYYDDGTRRTTGYDTTGQTWSTYEEDYNSAGQRVALRTYNDDGTRRTTQWDPASTANWSLIEEYFDASGNRTRQITDYDDGDTNRARLDTSWDVDNTHTWAYQTTQYNSVGAVVRIYGLNDNGTTFG
ncbi:MAG: hypothetical protein KDJ36_04515 [Hyphomicrobiaceae bacterium]|nr:hypothetical protein [Hyphomicrobiaceae bacterium]